MSSTTPASSSTTRSQATASEEWQAGWADTLGVNIGRRGQRDLVRGAAHAARRPGWAHRQRRLARRVPRRARRARLRCEQGRADRVRPVARPRARRGRHLGRRGSRRASPRPTWPPGSWPARAATRVAPRARSAGSRRPRRSLPRCSSSPHPRGLVRERRGARRERRIVLRVSPGRRRLRRPRDQRRVVAVSARELKRTEILLPIRTVLQYIVVAVGDRRCVPCDRRRLPGRVPRHLPRRSCSSTRLRIVMERTEAVARPGGDAHRDRRGARAARDRAGAARAPRRQRARLPPRSPADHRPAPGGGRAVVARHGHRRQRPGGRASRSRSRVQDAISAVLGIAGNADRLHSPASRSSSSASSC